MKEAFDKIVERLEELKSEKEIGSHKVMIKEAIEIVNQVAEEFGGDINVGSKWIPCSKRLPEEKGWYQCTCVDEELWTKPLVRDLFYYPAIKLFVDNIRYSEHRCVNIKKYDWTKYVIAWQPLPAPYKPKGNQ